MWLPDPLYRKMPALYLAAGALTLAQFGAQSPSVLSALLLFVAAAVTWRWRAKPPALKRQRRPGELPRKQSP